MKKAFKSFGDKYGDTGELANGFPDYVQDDIHDWIRAVLYGKDLVKKYSNGTYYLTEDFRKYLQREFGRKFDASFPSFSYSILGDPELTACFLSLILRTIAHGRDSRALMYVLDHINSEYCVRKQSGGAIGDWDEGGCDLEYRVSGAEKLQAAEALDENDMLIDAWNHCYRASPKPNYEKAVSICTDFLEGYLRDRLYPSEERTLTIPQFIKRFDKRVDELKFMGDTFLEEKLILIKLLDGVSNIRGQHTTGKGKPPSAEEARYILHTTIYIWTLMNGVTAQPDSK